MIFFTQEKLYNQLRGCLAGLLMRRAPLKWLRLVCFSLENVCSYKTFGKAPPKEPGRSPTAFSTRAPKSLPTLSD